MTEPTTLAAPTKMTVTEAVNSVNGLEYRQLRAHLNGESLAEAINSGDPLPALWALIAVIERRTRSGYKLADAERDYTVKTAQAYFADDTEESGNA